jgi:zinc/manganese transport system substrate-binding protein
MTIPRLSLLFALGFALLASLAAQTKLNVVATTSDLGALAKEVGGDLITLTVLTRPTEDPHFVDAKPSFVLKLNKADILIEGGAELELGWLPPLLEGARNARIVTGSPGRVSCAKSVSLLEVPATLDRSKGDVHAAGNPHYLVDPENARKVATLICETFCTLDSGGQTVYRANLESFMKQLNAKLQEWSGKLAPYRGQRVVSYHNLWPYFAQRFGLQFDLFLEPKPGISPSPAHLAFVIGKIREDKIKVIVVEPFQSRKTAETVAADTGAKVVNVTQYPGGVRGTEGGYLQMMDYLVSTLAKALGE